MIEKRSEEILQDMAILGERIDVDEKYIKEHGDKFPSLASKLRRRNWKRNKFIDKLMLEYSELAVDYTLYAYEDR